MYIITPNAERISRAAFRDLYFNPSLDGKPNVTTHWWSVITHPTTGETAIEVDPDEPFTLKPNATGEELVELMGIPTQAEKNKGRQDIVNARGSRVQVKNLLPASILNAALTREEMEADGWFPVIEL